MAATSGQNGKAESKLSDLSLLLHPELLSRDFMRLLLSERNICPEEGAARETLTQMFLRHVVPRPQRSLPDSRWGRRLEEGRRGRGSGAGGGFRSDQDTNRKRPLIVFDGGSSNSGPLKVRKPEGAASSPSSSSSASDRLKPPPQPNPSNPIRKLCSSPSSASAAQHSSTDSTSTRVEENSSEEFRSPDVKRKIPRVTWP